MPALGFGVFVREGPRVAAARSQNAEVTKLAEALDVLDKHAPTAAAIARPVARKKLELLTQSSPPAKRPYTSARVAEK